MKIRVLERVVYAHNPLVEVVCQVRFDRILALETSNPSRFQEDFASAGFPIVRIEPASSIQIASSDPSVPASMQGHPNIPPVYHFSSENKQRKISLSSEFLAFSCAEYPGWEDFKAEFLSVLAAFSNIYSTPVYRRLGLRYKDLIEREALNLSNTPWKELLSPLVAGIFFQGDYFEGDHFEESAVVQQVSQVLLQLDDCNLLLQSALLKSSTPQSLQAFLIDSDFFMEFPKHKIEKEKMDALLDVLHTSAGSIFRHCIQEKLHDALSSTIG